MPKRGSDQRVDGAGRPDDADDSADDENEKDDVGGFFYAGAYSIDHHLRAVWWLIGAVDASEVRQIAAPRLLVQPFRVARLGNF